MSDKRSLREILDEKKKQTLERQEAAAVLEDSISAQPPQKLSLKEILALRKTCHVPAIGDQNFETTRTQYVVENATLGGPLPLTLNAIPKKDSIPSPSLETFSLSISLNKEQLLAKELAFSGKSFCLVGAAGTGKTTTQREVASSLLKQNKLSLHNFKIQGTRDTVEAPSIAFVAYTRIASGNLKKAIHKDPELEKVLQHNITTIHNLLEFTPEFYYDYEKQKETMRFLPKRNADNPLDITHLIIEESSMVGLNLWNQLYEALRPGVQIIFIGDINQLPPVMDKSILNYALAQLPVVELTHVYRQKEESLILENAHAILAGKPENIREGKDFLIMRNGETQHSQAKLAQMIGETFPRFAQKEKASLGSGYDPEQDIILSPFNKQDLGTDNINKYIAQFLAVERKAVTFEVRAGMNTLYLAEGDKVMYNKQVGIISRIVRNAEYHGKACKQPAIGLTRFGTYIHVEGETDVEEEDDFGLGYEDIDLEAMAREGQKDDLFRSASHIVTLEMETGIEVVLSAVGDFAASTFTLGYALTIHKAQGCEWRKVFIILHKDHSIMAFRELLYTAVTRASTQCILITKDFMIKKAIENPRIKGNTIAEKIEYFNSGLMDIGSVYCTK